MFYRHLILQIFSLFFFTGFRHLTTSVTTITLPVILFQLKFDTFRSHRAPIKTSFGAGAHLKMIYQVGSPPWRALICKNKERSKKKKTTLCPTTTTTTPPRSLYSCGGVVGVLLWTFVTCVLATLRFFGSGVTDTQNGVSRYDGACWSHYLAAKIESFGLFLGGNVQAAFVFGSQLSFNELLLTFAGFVWILCMSSLTCDAWRAWREEQTAVVAARVRLFCEARGPARRAGGRRVGAVKRSWRWHKGVHNINYYY